MRRVAIVAVEQTPYTETHADESLYEMYFRVTKALLDKAGISRDEVDTVIEASCDYWRGIACSNVHTVEASGGYLKEVSKVEQDGAFGFMYAYMRILSGHFDTALVVSDTKCSENMMPYSNLPNASADPFHLRWIGVDEISSAAMQATLYMSKYGVSMEQISEVSVKNLGNALRNPFAHRRMRVSVEDVMKSPVISYPLRQLHCCPYSDGICTILLASEEKAREITDTPVWVAGVGWCTDTYFLGDRDLLDTWVLKEAASRAYKMAGIENPTRDLDVIELSEPFAHQELLWYEGLGLCGKGEGVKLLEEGVTSFDGQLPVNPSGGVLASNPYIARGLVRIAEAALQIMGKAGEHQVPGAEKALAHGVGGFAGQAHAVICLSE